MHLFDDTVVEEVGGDSKHGGASDHLEFQK
jgi:hypothetical protein